MPGAATLATPETIPHLAVLRTLIMSWVLLSGLIGAGLIGPNRSLIQDEYGLSYTRFGVGLAGIQIGFALLVLLIAPLLRRFNYARVVLGGLGLQAVGLLVIWQAATLINIAAGWALVTIGVVIGSLFNNISMDLWPSNPRRGVLLLHAFNGIGKVLGPAIAGVLLVLGWRANVLCAGLLTLAVLAAFLIYQANIASLSARHQPRGNPVSLRILRRPLYWMCVLPFGLIAGGEAAFATLLPSFLEQHRGMSSELASWMLAIHLMGLVAGRFVFAHLSDRLGNNAIIALCLSAGVFVLPVVYVPSAAVLVACVFLLGVQFSSTWPTFYAQAARFLAEQRDMLAYGTGLSNMMGIALCIMLSSWIADASLPAGVLSGPVILVLFGLAYFTSRLSRPPVVASGGPEAA